MRADLQLARGANSRRRAAVAAELVLVLPVLMLLTLGAIDLGRFVYAYIAVTNAAFAGASYGSVNPPTAATQNEWIAAVQQAVYDDLSDFDQSKVSAPTVTLTSVSNVPNRVSVDVRYQFTTSFTWPGIPSTLTLERVVVLR